MSTQLQERVSLRTQAHGRVAPRVAPSVNSDPFSLDQELTPFGTWDYETDLGTTPRCGR